MEDLLRASNSAIIAENIDRHTEGIFKVVSVVCIHILALRSCFEESSVVAFSFDALRKNYGRCCDYLVFRDFLSTLFSLEENFLHVTRTSQGASSSTFLPR